MANKSFKQLFTEAQERDSFWTEKAKLQFANELSELMERRGVNKTDLAGRIGSSAAYITKALRGDTNFTIESMIKFVRALAGKIEIHVVAEEDREHRFLAIGQRTHTFSSAANDGDRSQPTIAGGIDMSMEVA